MNEKAARLGISNREYNAQKIQKRWSIYLKTQYLQQRRDNENANAGLPIGLPSFKEVVERIDRTPLHASAHLSPVHQGFEMVANPWLPTQERKTRATGPSDDIMK
jgi:hypothetical protein